MPTQDPVTTARTRLAGLYVGKRYGREPDPQSVAEARRALTMAHLDRAIGKALDADPALTDEQRAELAARLLDGAK